MANTGRRIGCAASLAAWGLLAACTAAEAPWEATTEDALDAHGKQQLELARRAKDALATRLMGELTDELGDSGAGGAIAVCAERAAVIAAEVAKEHGLAIGRTSWKLRNPRNRAPDWAAAVVADRPAEPRYVRGPEEQLGVTLPIRIMPACLQCHGDRATFDADVRAALEKRYPTDEAHGFADGDLRGWFWVEVP